MLLSTLQTFANCRSSPAQHTPGTCALRWLGIRTRREECGGEGQQEAVVRKKKIKSDRQTGREQPVDRVRNVKDEGSGSQRMHKCYKCGDRRQREVLWLCLGISPCLHQLLLQHDAPAGANAHVVQWRKRPADNKTSLFRGDSTPSNPTEDLQAKLWLSARNR